MTTLRPLVFGSMREHPSAPAFAREVVRVHRRYATEIVAKHRLCPFVRDVDVAFGRFCVALGTEVDLAEAKGAFVRAENPVVHLVYPLARVAAPEFERFGADVGRMARDVWRATPDGDPRLGSEPPVVATFHPKLPGDRQSAHRLIGLLRRAPDPFVQVIPGGHHESGTVVTPISNVDQLSPDALAAFLAKVPAPPKDRAQETFERLSSATLEELAAAVTDIHADRDRSYAPFLRDLGCA